MDLDHIDASYTDGVLALSIPVAEQAKPRKIAVAHHRDAGGPDSGRTAISSSDSAPQQSGD